MVKQQDSGRDQKLEDARDAAVPWEKNFREQVVRLRKSHKMNQTELARRLNAWGLPFHQQTVQRIETGERPVRLNEAHLIARVLDTTVEAMTVSAGFAERPIVNAVEDLRGIASAFADDLGQLSGDWIEKIDDLASIVYDMGEAIKAGETPTDLMRWAFEWLMTGREADVLMVESLSRFLHLAQGVEPQEVDLPGGAEHLDALMEGLWDVFHWPTSQGELPRMPPIRGDVDDSET